MKTKIIFVGEFPDAGKTTLLGEAVKINSTRGSNTYTSYEN